MEILHAILTFILNIIQSTVANIITFLLFSSVTGTNWFKKLINKIKSDFNNILKQGKENVS